MRHRTVDEPPPVRPHRGMRPRLRPSPGASPRRSRSVSAAQWTHARLLERRRPSGLSAGCRTLAERRRAGHRARGSGLGVGRRAAADPGDPECRRPGRTDRLRRARPHDRAIDQRRTARSVGGRRTRPRRPGRESPDADDRSAGRQRDRRPAAGLLPAADGGRYVRLGRRASSTTASMAAGWPPKSAGIATRQRAPTSETGTSTSRSPRRPIRLGTGRSTSSPSRTSCPTSRLPGRRPTRSASPATCSRWRRVRRASTP